MKTKSALKAATRFPVCLFIVASLFSCHENKTQVNPVKAHQDTLPTATARDEKHYGEMYSTDNAVITGDTTVANRISSVSVKFEPYISFENFKAGNVVHGLRAPINYSSNAIAQLYRTAITNTYKEEGVNFAGHYCFVQWDCGQPCVGSAIVDATNGKVYKGPTAPFAFAFRQNSRMVIFNAPDSAGFYEDCPYCHPEIWVWNEQLKKLEEIKPGK